MALTGNYIKIVVTPSETETEDVLVTYPADLGMDSPDFNKRGTSETLTLPVETETRTTLENTYLMVTGVSLEKIHGGDYHISFAYHLYESEEARQDNPLNSIEKGIKVINWDNDVSTDPITVAYEYLKTIPECINMTNV